MKIFKTCIGVALIIMGIVVGLYVGVWLCFIGGIVQIVEIIRSPESINAIQIGIGVLRVMFAGSIGWLSAVIFFLPATVLMSDD